MGIKSRKRIFFMVLLCFILCFAGCGKNEEQPQKQIEKTEEQKPDEKKIEEQVKANETIPEDLLPGGETEEQENSKETGTSVKESAKSSKNNTVVDLSKPDSKGEAPSKGDSKKESSSGDKAENNTQNQPEKKTIQVKISIECKNAVNEGYTGPTTLLSETSLTLPKGATVYDALVESGISFSGGGGYISGISGIYEFDWGEGSGWMYFVNGSKPGVGCASYTCEDGDVIRWRYTTNLGKDL